VLQTQIRECRTTGKAAQQRANRSHIARGDKQHQRANHQKNADAQLQAPDVYCLSPDISSETTIYGPRHQDA
jgi:hypothetical protein